MALVKVESSWRGSDVCFNTLTSCTQERPATDSETEKPQAGPERGQESHVPKRWGSPRSVGRTRR